MSRNQATSNKLSFQANSGIDSYLLDGWSVQEPSHRWTNGSNAKMKLHLSGLGVNNIILRMACAGYLAGGKLDHQTVDVLVNDVQVANWEVRQKNWHEANIPLELVKNGEMTIDLLISNPTSPLDLNISDDRRKLGIRVLDLEVIESGDVDSASTGKICISSGPNNVNPRGVKLQRDQIMKNEKFLFICGCPRSGTTALTHVFNWHPKVFIGVERFANLFKRDSNALNPDLFTLKRFSEILQGDCGYSSFEQMKEYSIHYGRRRELNDISTALVVGDKITQLYENFDVFEEDNWVGESVTIVQIIRNVFDVARSYEARNIDPNDKWKFGYVDGIREWDRAIGRGLHAAESNAPKTRFLVVNYENLFERGEEQFLLGCNKLIKAIGLEVSQSVEDGLKKVYKHGEGAAKRRVDKTALVADEEIISNLSTEALENYSKLQALAFI